MNDGDRTWYLTMNLTQPPFDDVHVRRAVNFVDGPRRLCARPGAAPPPAPSRRTSRPTRILGNKLKGYAPYGNGTRATSPRPRPR